jgi:hypothetical protein
MPLHPPASTYQLDHLDKFIFWMNTDYKRSIDNKPKGDKCSHREQLFE